MNSITITDGNINLPGIKKLQYVPVQDVQLIPTDVQSIVVSDISLVDGAGWYNIEFSEGKLQFGDVSDSNEDGSFHKIDVEGFHPFPTAAKLHALRSMLDERFILLITDYQDDRRICGTLNSPCSFFYKEQSGAFGGTEVKGYSISFNTEDTKPALYYQASSDQLPGAEDPLPGSGFTKMKWYNSSDPVIAGGDEYERYFVELEDLDIDDFAISVGGPWDSPNFSSIGDYGIVSLIDGVVTRSIPFPEHTGLLLLYKA
ncbi:MAG: hypothetical protein ACKVPJ_13550 [Chitinophagales bacterium]